MSCIKEVFDEITTCCNDSRTKEELLTDCVRQRLTELYLIQSEQLDIAINELMSCIQTDNISQMYNILKRLSKCLSGNRNQLIYLLEKVTS